jgi:hypothetical protein
MKNFKHLILIAGVLSLFVAAPAFAAPVINDYTNYWSFDDAGGRSVSDIVGGQNGAIVGTSTGFGWASGKVGTALMLDGGAGEAVTLPNGFLKGSQGSLSVWLKLDALSDSNIIFSGKSTIDNNVYVAFSIDRDGRPMLQFRDSVNATDRKAQGTKLLNKNEWYNLVLTASGQTYHMYLNGEDVTIAGANIGRWFPDITNHTFIYRIGMNDATPMSGVFTGILDEMKIYDRPLSMEDITALYNEGNAGTPTVPLAIRPLLSFSISTDHTEFGGSVVVNWAGTNVTSCIADGGWSGTMPVSGTQTFMHLGSDTTYGLTCSGVGGNTHSSVRVAVAQKGVTSVVTTSTGAGLTVTSLPIETGSHIQNDINVTAVSGGQTATATSDAEKTRRALIQKLIDQILVLIAELQKQLAVLKAQGTTTTHY